MKITTERLVEIIKEEVDAYVVQEKLKGKKKAEFEKLKGKKNLSDDEEERKKELKHQ